MKNSTLAFLARFGCLLLSSLFVNITATKAQCYMVCNNNVPVSLDENCEAVILPDDILEGFETTPCEGPFIIEIYDLDDNLIPTSPMVNGDHIGQTLTVHAIDGESTNYCWGTILVEDKMAPVMTNCEPLALPCTVDPQPMAGQPFIGSTGYARFPSRGIGPHVSTISESFWVDLPDNAFIVDVNIVLEIEHSASEHLDVYLSNPSGTVVELGTDLCGAFPNWSVTFADDAPVQAASACNAAANPTLSGIVQPEGQLSDFNNLPAKGAWTLSITDDTNGDGGTLHGIWLTIEYILLAAYQPTATDNCGTATLTHTDAITPGTCNDPFSQIIDRTWTATDQSGNTSQCVQTITFNRLALGDVVLPPDFDGISLPALLCDDKTPGNLTSPNIGWNALSNGHPSPYDAYYPAPNDHIVKWYGTGLPVGTCDKIQYTYNDQRIEICPGTGSDACFKILRTWTLTDWCTGEVRTARQIIKVADNEAPTIEDIEDVTIGTDPHSCQATWLASLPTLLDNCNPAAQLSYSLNSSSGIISPLANNRYQVSGLKLGMHIITYTASDCCGNEATKTIKLTVVDSQPPTAVCDEHTQIILTIDGTTKAFAHTFDDQSHDNCGQVYFKLVRMDEMDSNGNGIRPESVSQGDWASIACDAVNGDDDAGQPGSQSYFDDFAKFCCDDADADFVQVVFRTFDIDPGAGPVDPTRMEAGGDLYGRYNDCMVEAVIVDKSPPIISYPDDVTLLCYEDYRDTSLTGMPEVFDNCALDTTFFEDDPDLNPCQVGKVTRTWTAIDGNGLSKSCTQMITLIDTTAPMIFFPPDTVVGCGESMEPDSTGRAYGTDDCSILYVNYKDLLFEFPDSCTRKILRTWTVLDWCTGEQWTDLQAIKEFDQQPPVIVGVPNDTLVDCDQVPPPPAIGSDLVGEDNCDRDVDIDFDENRIDGDCPYNYTLQRIWTAEDNCGNVAVDTQIISVVDTIAPEITGLPADLTLECDEPNPPAVTPTVTDNCNPDPRLSSTESMMPGDCEDNFTIVRSWTATDTCGNSRTATQTITFDDTTPPVISGIPASLTLECDEAVPPNAMPSATDNCDPMPVLSMSEQRIDGSCEDQYTIIRTWMATDRCGNSSTRNQQIVFEDTTPPVISGVPANLTLECDEPVPPAATPTATDNCDPDPHITLSDELLPGNCDDQYTLVRTWTAIDNCGNTAQLSQRISVEDTTPPVISGVPANFTLECDEPIPPGTTPSATDNCDPDPELTMGEQRIDGICEGNYTIVRSWTATDRCGNSSSMSQQIHFEDTTPPVLIGVPADITAECDNVPSAATLTATDNCDPDPHVTLSDELLPGNCDDQYTLVRTWTAIDDCGNTAQLSQRISVEDTTPPVISGVPANLTLECDEPIPPGTTPSATDNCDPDPELTMGEQRIDGICEDNYTIVRSWTATDRCGNSSSMSQQIHFEDTTPPVLIGVPADITAECIDNSNPVVTATDNCDPMVEINMTTTSADPCVGNNVRILTWTATDNCGNTSTTSQQITLEDTTPPTLTGVPDDVTAECDAIPPRMDPVATDTCSGVLIVFEEERQDGRCDNEYLLIRRWMATDGCGNVVVDSQRVNVVDTTPPVLSGIPNDTTVICTEVPDPPEIGTEITASDNCDAMVDIRAEADTLPGNCVNQFTIRRIWVATDDCENESRDTQLINLIDTIPPIINGVPNDTTILCDAAVPPFNSQTIGTTDVCTSLVSISIKADTLAGRCENEFTIQRIWIATDDCENESRDTQFIQILDTIPPVLVGVPDDVTVSCDDVPEPPSIGGEITATDNCDDLVDISLAMDSLPGRCPNEFILRRIWTAIDNCDNMSRDTQLIQLIDTIPPVITGVPDDIEVLCESVPLPPDISTIGATDNCDPDPELSFVADTLPGSCTYEFTIRRIWIATDTCDNMSRDTQLISVMDTLPPLLTGVPADTMVECSEIPDAPVIGAGVAATDNCDTMVVIQLIVDSLPGNCENEYTLVRIWTAEDDCGNMSRDTQNLFVFDNTPPVLSGIPNDTTADCRDMIAMPVVTATDNCDTLVTIRLDVQQDGPCAHTFGITRIWTATDNCGNSSTASQMIFIEDSIPPVLTVPAPIRFEIRHGDSCDVFLPLIATAMDNCDDNVTITHNFAMAHDPFSTTGDASGDYPIGDRFVVFTAVDACGNTTIDSTRIQVVDKFGPAFMCQSFTDTLDPVTGYFILEPGDIMVFAQDLCSPPETMTFSPISSPNPLFDTITCDDAPVIPLEFIEVTDAAGNTNVCGASVNVIQPNPIFCDTFTPAPPGYWIAGQLSTEEGDYIEAADVMISGAMNAQAVNEAYGFYYFNGVEGGYNYSVQPEKNDDPLNGVSTFDLVLISKHILGISPLSSPYKLIAADINNSGTITTFDIVELRKLILFINTEFPHNTSWRFIDADFTFPLSNDPFSSTFPEFYSINNLSENKMDVHFTGIKIGDVNGSVQAHNLLDADSRNAQRLPLVVEDQLVEAGESVEVSFQAADFKNIEGFQLSLGFDQQLLELEEIGQTTQLTGLTRESFGTALVDKGVLTMSWFDSKPTSKDDGAALFSLRFRAKATALLSKALHLADGYTSAEAYPAGAAPLGLQLQFEQPLQSLPQADFQLFQNRPNPFADETIIPFYLPQPTEAVLSVYDVSGKLVLQRKASYAAGYQELRVSVGELSGAQLYYYQLKTERYMATRKMVFQGP